MARLALALVVVAALAGCGGDDQPQTAAPTTPTPTATATPTPTPTPTATATATPSPTPTATPEKPEEQPGGAGDEEPIRVPVEFTVRDRGISPAQVAVPAFLGMELIVHNETAGTIVARLQGAAPLTVASGQTGHVRLEGRKKGQYVVDFGDAGQALLVTGAEPGP